MSYRNIQSEEVKRHLLHLLENPEGFTKSGKKWVIYLFSLTVTPLTQSAFEY